MFLLMEAFAGAAGLSANLYSLAYALVGHLPGGLAMSTIGGSAGFGAVCGSSVTTAAVMTHVALPEMLKRGYQPALATGCIAAGGTLGMLILPSVIMVLYAVLTGQFVIALFVVAIMPGLVAVLLHFAAILTYVRYNPDAGPAGPKMPWPERWQVVMFLLHLMYLILGSIFDTVAAMVITLPFVFPLIVSLGFDPIWFGVINVMVIEMGMITPSTGINVFVLHGIARSIPLNTIFRGIVPFPAADLVRLSILALLPGITLWLPGVMGILE